MPEVSGIEQLPLPGGADLGSHPYEITAEFADVLSLAPQSSVKVNDVAVGRVTEITLDPDDWSAKVTMRVNGDVKLPANAYAHLEQSSLLGEKYIQLTPPAKGRTAQGVLADGAAIPMSRTNRNPEVEEVFGALSLLLNGGGVNQIKTIATELNKALGGREPKIRSLLKQVDTLVTSLDDNKEDITAALDGVNRLAATLATRKQQVGTVLTGLSPGLKVLEQQRGSLLTMLRALGTLSEVAVDTIDKSKTDTIASLKALAPTLRALADSGQDLPDSLQVLLTYPFTDEVLRGVKGDYLNVYLDMTAVPGTTIIPEYVPDDAPAAASGSRGGTAPLPLPALTPTTGPGGGTS
ncbi:MCE family protein [Streptomyces sp. NPDC006283]|uniref:MCE family protein n=1 Tax=Streptomyces sp. NPDC006283 TaxID=3156741 RepID=UPI0033B59060